MAKKPKYSIRDVLTEQERAQALAEMTIFSDIVATKFFDDTGITEYILRAVTGQQDLVVTEVKTQSIIDNPIGHSVRFDVLAKDAEGTLYDIEIQNVSGDDLLQRADYYGASTSRAPIPTRCKTKRWQNVTQTLCHIRRKIWIRLHRWSSTEVSPLA